jgi:hypothetical protein
MGSGLPGDGNVTCEIQAGESVGICRNPTGCNPHGNVCHYKDYACSISSARNDCCGAPGNSGACQLDPLGVPRCNVIGACRQTNDTCASAADCCDGARCIADATGSLRCGASAGPDAGPICSGPGASCTINGDCCPGYVCVAATGSTQGTCGTYTPPPPPVDAGTYDAAPPPPYDGGPLACALYGQSCKADADCCGGVTCTNASGATCGPTDTGCICYTPIR